MVHQLGKTTNDFSDVATAYLARYIYGQDVLSLLQAARGAADMTIADIGAGAGTLTKMLAAGGATGYAVEPSESMRAVGMTVVAPSQGFEWREGTAEATGLPDACIDWAWMGDAFHWTDHARALREIRRILKPGGQFTAIWCLRDLARDPFQREVDTLVRRLVPGIRRVYEDIEQLFPDLPQILTRSGSFSRCIHVEGWHGERTSRDRYLQMFCLSHDIQSQAGRDSWHNIIRSVKATIGDQSELRLSYNTRSWTVEAG